MLVTVTFSVDNDTLHKLGRAWGLRQGQYVGYVELEQFIRDLVRNGIEYVIKDAGPQLTARVRRRQPEK